MTFADAIIQGKVDQVRAALARGEDVRQIRSALRLRVARMCVKTITRRFLQRSSARTWSA